MKKKSIRKKKVNKNLPAVRKPSFKDIPAHGEIENGLNQLLLCPVPSPEALEEKYQERSQSFLEDETFSLNPGDRIIKGNGDQYIVRNPHTLKFRQSKPLTTTYVPFYDGKLEFTPYRYKKNGKVGKGGN